MMIHDFEEISNNIAEHVFARDSYEGFLKYRIDALESAVKASLNAVCEDILAKQSKVHIALSGGVDSSTLLFLMLREGFPVVAHTIASSEIHPDMHYATLLTKELGIGHERHIFKSNKDVSKYYLLFDSMARSTKRIVCGDCIDELLGGYYAHRDPTKLCIYDDSIPLVENRLLALEYYMSRLFEDHLMEQNIASERCGVEVYLPYAAKGVFENASKFAVEELVDDCDRKKPLLAIALKNGVPYNVVHRRKFGLVQIMDDITC